MIARREIAALATAGAVAAAMVAFDRRSAATDERNALALVRAVRGTSGRGLEETISAAHGAVTWSAARESSCFAHVRVDARGADDADVAFVVDLLEEPLVHPANPLGEQAIRATLAEVRR